MENSNVHGIQELSFHDLELVAGGEDSAWDNFWQSVGRSPKPPKTWSNSSQKTVLVVPMQWVKKMAAIISATTDHASNLHHLIFEENSYD